MFAPRYFAPRYFASRYFVSLAGFGDGPPVVATDRLDDCIRDFTVRQAELYRFRLWPDSAEVGGERIKNFTVRQAELHHLEHRQPVLSGDVRQADIDNLGIGCTK